MESLVKSVDTNQWDRIAMSLIATEFPILLQKLASLKKSIAMIVAGDPGQGEGDSPTVLAYDDTRIVMDTLEKLRKNPRLARSLKRKKINLIDRSTEGVVKMAFKIGSAVLPQGTLPIPKSLTSEPEVAYTKSERDSYALYTIERSYRISQQDFHAWGFTGDAKEYLLLLYENLYAGSSKKNYLEVCQLYQMVLDLQKQLKTPGNWHELHTSLSSEKLDVYAVVEILWAKIAEIEGSMDDIPGLQSFLRTKRVSGYFDPAVSFSRMWQRIRGKV